MSLTFYGFVGTAPAVTAQPTATTVDAGQPATFTAAGSGNPVPAGPVAGVDRRGQHLHADIVGANSTTLSVSPTAADDGNQYQAVLRQLDRVGDVGSGHAERATRRPR